MKNVKLLMMILFALTVSCSPASTPTRDAESTETVIAEPVMTTPTLIPPTAAPTHKQLEYPVARGFTQLQLHPPSGKMILFGGESNSRRSYSDTWEYDPASNVWTERFPEIHPDGVGGVASTYDVESDRFIFYFSTILDRSVSNGLVGISETWAYDFNTNTWENMNPKSHPEKVMGIRLAYDSESDRVILFGGADFTANETITFTETWAYDYNTNSWEKMNPAQTPAGRSYYGMDYAASLDRIYVFGGRVKEDDEDRQNELWAYDYNSDSWSEVGYTGDPEPNHHAMLVYNPQVDELWYLVGTSLMAFDLKTSGWKVLATSPTAKAIHFHGMEVESSGNLIVFGGGPRGLTYNNKFFMYSLNDQAWQPLGP